MPVILLPHEPGLAARSGGGSAGSAVCRSPLSASARTRAEIKSGWRLGSAAYKNPVEAAEQQSTGIIRTLVVECHQIESREVPRQMPKHEADQIDELVRAETALVQKGFEKMCRSSFRQGRYEA